MWRTANYSPGWKFNIASALFYLIAAVSFVLMSSCNDYQIRDISVRPGIIPLLILYPVVVSTSRLWLCNPVQFK